MLLGLRVGDPHDEILGTWLAKESVRDVFLTDDPAEAELLLDKAIVGCLDDQVPEVVSLGHTLSRWRTEILNHHITGASNGPTEALNLLVKKEALRAWVSNLRPLPATRPVARRWRHPAATTSTTQDQNPLSHPNA